MAVLIVNPNPVFDRTITVPELIPGAVIRVGSVELTAGGKGINVARVLRSLGDPAPLLVPVGASDRARYEDLLRREGAEFSSVEVSGAVRIASIYLEEASPRVTVINDAGDPMSQEDWERVAHAIVTRVEPGDIVLCMGSFPPGLDPQAVSRLVREIHDRGAAILLDCNPPWLAAALPAHPDVVTPNIHEAEAVISQESALVMGADEDDHASTRDRAERAAQRLCDLGAVRALVTAGSAGVALAGEGRVAWLPAFPVTAVSTVGAGDSFVAGLAHVWSRSGQDVDWEQATRFGIATAAASCEQVRAGGVDPARALEIDARLRAEAA